MSKIPHGLYVPLVTPFHADESVDYEGYRKIIDNCIEGGMDGLLIAGSTGEFYLMTNEERKELIRKGCEIINGRVEVICGTSQSTAKETIKMTNFAAECGADYALIIPPYYQLTTEEEIYGYFKEISDHINIGIIIYHTPGNTTVELSPEFIRRLGQLEHVVAVKETTDGIHTANTYMATYDLPDFCVMEANEPKLLTSFALGIESAFSIVFNVIPKDMKELYDLCMKGDFATARELNKKYSPLYDLMEAEPYPGPIKAALNAVGLPGGIVRKPLPQPSEQMKKDVAKVMSDLGYKTIS